MEQSLRTRMVFHGAIVVLLGLAAGFPYGLVVMGSMEGSERAWRMAHMEGLLNGLLVIAIAAAGSLIALAPRLERWLALALVGMAYGNVVAATLGALSGERGLVPGLSLANSAVYVLFMLAVVAILLGMGLVAHGARGRAGGSAAR